MNCFLITTYNRSEACRQLVEKLNGDIYILSDGSDYDWIDDYNVYFKVQKHKGKRLYTETVNDLFKMPVKEYDYYFIIQDDLLPVPGFERKAKEVWRDIPEKICLMTYVDQGRLNKPCWTKFEPIEFKNYRQTQWVDMCAFMCQKEFFTALGEIPHSKLNWDIRPDLSSGVGSLISSHLHEKGYKIFQTLKSLFISQDVESQMNNWRDKDNLINKAVL